MQKKTKSHEYTEEFEKIWQQYPKKTGKFTSYSKYKRLLREYSYEDIERAVQRYTKEVSGRTIKFIKCGEIFLGKAIENYIDEDYQEVNQEEVFSSDTKKCECKYNELYEEMMKKFKTMPYEQYLQTEHWTHFKDEAVKNARYTCQLCNKSHTKLNVHHKTYENRGRETFLDVIVLCADCHKKIHNIKVEE